MPAPVLDTDTIVIGTLTTLAPSTAWPTLQRLEPGDFPRWPAQLAHGLLCTMALDAPSLDVATLVGYALHTAAVKPQQWTGFTRFLCDAASVGVPAAALDFHIRLLIEATYRRRVAAGAARLAQAADNPAVTIDDLNHHRATVAADLDHHHARLTTANGLAARLERAA